MYSLYRAWFGGEESYPRLDRLSPPDVLVRVGNQGEHQFVAHKEVLATHSGYMKALLGASVAGSSSSSADAPITSVSVSSVGGEAFAPLLNYMYTGRLEVTLDNIYSVLLATHLLHMPGALEECRNALLTLRTPATLSLSSPPSQISSSILRPVPNRLVAPPFCWPQPSLYPPGSLGLPPHFSHLQMPPAMPVTPPTVIQGETPSSSVPYSMKGASSSSVTASPPLPQVSRSRSTSPGRGQTSGVRQSRITRKEDTEHTIRQKRSFRSPLTKARSPSASSSSEKISVTDLDHVPTRRRSRSRHEHKLEAVGDVVYDVACCDGPGQFHRVLNENYAAPSTTQTPSKALRGCLESDNSSENEENGRPDNASAASEADGAALNGNYTCKYCLHTFKSQYCYRKHARRHLLPTETETSHARFEGRKQDELVQDLNVQYYPCKICGSKFPSYYFVHKHRKLCHSGAEENTKSVTEESGAATSVTESTNS